MTDKKIHPGFALFLFLIVAWPYYANDIYLILFSDLKISLQFFWLLDVIFFTLIPAITLFTLYHFAKLDHIKTLLRTPPGWLRSLAAVSIAYVCYKLFTLGAFSGLYGSDCGRLCTGYPFPRPVLIKFVVIIYAALSAGILEELIFRGHLFHLLGKFVQSKVVIILVGSLIFAAIHWCEGLSKMAFTYLFALVPSIWFIWKKDLWSIIIFHAVYDLLAFT